METTTLTDIKIRPFIAADYAAMADLHNANFAPEFTMEADEFQFEDEHQPAYCQRARWVAECDGRAVGFGHYAQNSHIYHPRKFQLAIVVHPAYQTRGIGRRLYDLVLDEVRRFDPLSVDEWSREDMVYRVGFFERRGFVADLRMWTSVLDLTTFEPGRFAATVAAVEAQGIQVRSLAELGLARPDVRRKTFELWSEVRHDVPLSPTEVRSEVTLERFWEDHDRPSLLPAGYFLALDGDEFVGTSQLWIAPEADTLRTGLTGVRRAYRRRGIALALKVRALAFAQTQGYKRVNTENEINNQGMLGINGQLGFVRNPAWVHYVRVF